MTIDELRMMADAAQCQFLTSYANALHKAADMLADRDAEIERLTSIANGRICQSCLEQHPIEVMCPPHEMRVTGNEWFRQQVARLERENAELNATIEMARRDMNRMRNELQAERDRLFAENVELRKDAERYLNLLSDCETAVAHAVADGWYSQDTLDAIKAEIKNGL